MKPTNEVTAMVIDNGVFLEQAVQLSKTYKKVYYHVPHYSGFPKMNNAYIGLGFEGIEVVTSMWAHFDEIDLYVFPDVGFGELQEHLLSCGKVVWGSRMGEELELDRVLNKKLMQRKGLPVGPYSVVTGVKKLRDFLKENENQYVKIDKFRGHVETFFSENYRLVEPVIDKLEYDLGAYKNMVEFVVEESLPNKKEFGTDGYCIDGKFPSKTLTGFEIKDKTYAGRMMDYDKVPKPVTQWEQAMSPVLKKYGYRGWLSTESRIGDDKIAYMIDSCCRGSSPCNELYQAIYSNFAEIVWQGANGKLIDPEPIAEYGVDVMICSTWSDSNWQPIDFPEELKPFIKLRNACKVDDRYYIIPQVVGSGVGAVIGYGSSLQSAIDMAKSITDKVSGYYLDIFVDNLDDAVETIEAANKIFPGMMEVGNGSR